MLKKVIFFTAIEITTNPNLPALEQLKLDLLTSISSFFSQHTCLLLSTQFFRHYVMQNNLCSTVRKMLRLIYIVRLFIQIASQSMKM